MLRHNRFREAERSSRYEPSSVAVSRSSEIVTGEALRAGGWNWTRQPGCHPRGIRLVTSTRSAALSSRRTLLAQPVAATTSRAMSTTSRPSVATRTVFSGARWSRSRALRALPASSCSNSAPRSRPTSRSRAAQGVRVDETPIPTLGEVRPHGSQIALGDLRAVRVSLWRRMHLPHEVTIDDRVSDGRGAQQRRDLPPHRRLADTSSPSDKQCFRVVNAGSLPSGDHRGRCNIGRRVTTSLPM